MSISDILQDRQKMMKLAWLAFVSSLFFIALGLFIIVRDLLA